MPKSTKEKIAKSVQKLSFEQCLEHLQHVVQILEDGNTGLSESLGHYEQGVAYLQRCQELLEDAEHKVELLSGVDADGNPITQRFDESEMSLQEKATKRSRRRTGKPKEPKDLTENESTSGDVDDRATLF